MSESPFTVIHVADRLSATLPIRWRIGRITAISLSIWGAMWALAGYFAGLMPAQIAGGECFGGGILLLSGLSLGVLLWSLKTNQISNRSAWICTSVMFLILGVVFLASGYSKIHKLESDRRQLRENLEQLSRAIKGVEPSDAKRDL